MGRKAPNSRPSRKDSWLAAIKVRSLTNTPASPVTRTRNRGLRIARSSSLTSAEERKVGFIARSLGLIVSLSGMLGALEDWAPLRASQRGAATLGAYLGTAIGCIAFQTLIA